MTATATDRIPERSEVDPGDCWDLSGLYSDVEAWEADFADLEARIGRLAAYAGRLGESPTVLAEFLALDTETDRVLRKVSNYAGRRSDEDTSNSYWKGLTSRVQGLMTRLGEATAFFSPELMAVPDETMATWLDDPALSADRFLIEKILRHKPHTLSAPEERILALSGEVAQAPYEAFGQLTNADLQFGTITDEKGQEVQVTQGRYLSFLSKPDRDVRRRFFEKLYAGYESVQYTLAATLGGGIKRDLFYARARGYESSRAAALFANNVPAAVYDNLIETVGRHLDVLYRYYELRRKALEIDTIHFYDIFVPIVSEIETDVSYTDACQKIVTALAPLGEEYTRTLEQGLLGGWVDRYENKGKRSGAYSSGCYDSDPFILMNYRPDTLDSLFTLAHEAGHSMHSWHSNRHQTPQYAGYSIFVAEVASTFNEALLSEHLLAETDDPRMRAYLLNREIDDIRSTLFRQTMFADFEHALHARAEANEPLALDDIKALYHGVLERYYGPGFTLDPILDLECFRVPHFYYNFYVFQYATGLSAAMALATKVEAGEDGAIDRYLGFLSGGSSQYPIDLLREAGVDMTSPDPVESALAHFGRRVDELETLLAEI